MSLLAGIKFVPKKERDTSHTDKKRKKDIKDDKKHKKRRREDRSESDSDKSNDERQKHISSRRRYDGKRVESSDDEDYMFRQLREEEESRRQVRFEEEQPTKPSSFDPNRFRSLLAGLTQKTVDNEGVVDSSTTSTSNHPDSSENARDDNIITEELSYEPPTLTIPITNTNKGAADFLRRRLQQSRKAPTLPVASSSSSFASNSASYDIEKARTNMLIHAKTQQKRQERAGEVSISALMSAERFADDADMDQTFTKNILRLGDRYQGTEGGRTGDRSGVDEEQAVDMSMYQRHHKDNKGKDQDPTQMLRQQLQQAGKDRERRQYAISSCRICSSLSSPGSNMEISRGEFFILRLKAANFRLAPTHLELLSLPHVPSLLHVLDEDEVIEAEYKRFVGCVRAMFRAQGRVAIITEAAVTLDHKQHCILDIIPVETQLVDEVLMSFRVAFLGEGDEWASAQRRAIPLTNQRPITRAVPKNFPYLSVLYDDEDNGLAHPVEKDMSKDYHGFFCYDVLAGVLEEDEARMRKNRPVIETMQEREKLVKEVKRQFEAYDWTDLGK